MSSKRTRTAEPAMTAAAVSCFPLAIIIDILSRLPVKSLVRFKSVSKSWFALIKSPSLVTAHLNRSAQNPSLFLRYYNHLYGNDPGMLLLRGGDSSPSQRDVEFPLLDGLSTFPKVIGSCNGLLCLDVSSCFGKSFVLWNPSTTDFKRLPEPLVSEEDRFKRFWIVSVGFGFNPKSNDYQIVRIVNFDDHETRVEVYKTSTGVWKEIVGNSSLLSSVICSAQGAVAVKGGVLYWMANWVGTQGSRRFLATYDMNKEAFSRTVIPEFPTEYCVKAVAYNGSVGLAVYLGFRGMSNRFEMWAMNEGKSWNQLLNFNSMPRCVYSVGGFMGNVIIIKREHDFFLFDVVAKANLDNLPINGMEYSYKIFTYVESIVGVNGDHDQEEDGEKGIINVSS